MSVYRSMVCAPGVDGRMIMIGVKDKRFGKLGRKRIWPSILMFGLFVCVCVAAFSFLIYLCAVCIMGTKISGHYEEALQVSAVFSELLDNGETAEEAAAQMQNYVVGRKDICLTDQSGRILLVTGDSQPDFDLALKFDIKQDVAAVADSKSGLVSGQTFASMFRMPAKDIFAGAFEFDDQGKTRAEWMDETIIRQDYWLRAPLKNDDYLLYIKYNLQAQRQDIAYVYILGFAAIIILLIPVILLFVNTLRSIIMQRRRAQLIYLDTVTGGRNWLYFRNSGHRILTRLRNSRKAFAMVDLHLERYNNYRACYGVKAGEELLEAMSGFLSARVGKNEAFARNEGADFGFLIQCAGENEQEYRDYCVKRVRSLLAELTGLRPDQKIRFHAGVDLIPPYIAEDGKWYHARKNVDIDELYTYANAARHESDETQEQRIAFFDQDMLGRQKWERWVEDNVEAALRNEEFQVYLQPKYNPATGKLVGAEALVRWVSLSTGLITPGHFIPIFERTGFITKLDDYMISHVARLQAEWMIQGKKMIPISVNVSRAHFAQEGLAEHICQLVDAYGPSHELIELEVTESAFFDDKDILVETVKQLKAYGFRVSMDDFGAGYSSLNSRKDIPLDVLKLDGEFFNGDEDGVRRGEIVVKEAIQLAKNLNMSVVAEGIERKEQVDFLASQDCDMIQGFYYAKPMPIDEFEKKVEKDA